MVQRLYCSSQTIKFHFSFTIKNAGISGENIRHVRNKENGGWGVPLLNVHQTYKEYIGALFKKILILFHDSTLSVQILKKMNMVVARENRVKGLSL